MTIAHLLTDPRTGSWIWSDTRQLAVIDTILGETIRIYGIDQPDRNVHTGAQSKIPKLDRLPEGAQVTYRVLTELVGYRPYLDADFVLARRG